MKRLFLLMIILGCTQEPKINDKTSEKVTQKKESNLNNEDLFNNIEDLFNNISEEKREGIEKELEYEKSIKESLKSKLEEKTEEIKEALKTLNQKDTVSKVLFAFNSNMKEMLKIVIDSSNDLDVLLIEKIFSLLSYKYGKCSLEQIKDIMHMKNVVLSDLKEKINVVLSDLKETIKDFDLISRIDSNREELYKIVENCKIEHMNLEDIDKVENFINYLKFYDEDLINKEDVEVYSTALVYAIESKSLKLINALLDRGASLDKKVRYINFFKHKVEVSSIEHAKETDLVIFCYLSILKMNKDLNNIDTIDKFIINNIIGFNEAIMYFVKDDNGFLGLMNNIHNGDKDLRNFHNCFSKNNFDLKCLLSLVSERGHLLFKIKENLNMNNEMKIIDNLDSINKELNEYLINYININSLEDNYIENSLYDYSTFYSMSFNLLKAILKKKVNLYYVVKTSKFNNTNTILLENILLATVEYNKNERDEILLILIELIKEQNIINEQFLISALKMADQEQFINLIKAILDKGFKFKDKDKNTILEFVKRKKFSIEDCSYLEKNL